MMDMAVRRPVLGFSPGMFFQVQAHQSELPLHLDVVAVPFEAGRRNHLHGRAVGADAREAHRRRDVQVRGEADARLARRAGEDDLLLFHRPEIDAVPDDVRRAVQRRRTLARLHDDAVYAADRRGLDAVQPDDGARGHEQAAAGLPRPVQQFRVGDERADADDHGALARGEGRLDEAGHDGRARSLDEQVRLLDQLAGAHVRRRRAERVEELAGARLRAACDASDLHAAERAVVSGAQDGPAYRAAPDDADGGGNHGGYFSLPSSSQAT